LRFHPRVDWTSYAELRLFRNDPRIRFRGPIHEQMRDSIDTVAVDDGLTIGNCDLVIQHVGYEDDQSRKNSRNIPLLRARLARLPTICFLVVSGQCLSLAGDDEGAMAAGRAEWRGQTCAALITPDQRCAVRRLAGPDANPAWT
jgi:hypothetical protein